ncbi:MAG: hypothetical protein IID40_12030 [Planctomycetes bacterium]|nr:hypothetical protein [Planctomycetota bacterium]
MDSRATETLSVDPQDNQTPGSPADRRPWAFRTAVANLLLPSRCVLGVGPRASLHWLVPGGLLIGLLYVGLFRASWRVFGEVGGVRLMPALAVWLADGMLFGLVMFLGAAQTVDRWKGRDLAAEADAGRALGQAGLTALFVLLVVKLVLWCSLPEGVAGWPADWRRHFNFAYPRPVLRPLILAPLWGRWALILAAGIGRRAPGAGAPDKTPAPPPSPAAVLGWFLPILALTAVYCGRQGRWMIGCIIGLAVMGVAFLFAVIVSRRFLGHTRFTVLATGLVAEIAFLLCYLAASQRIYYY